MESRLALHPACPCRALIRIVLAQVEAKAEPSPEAFTHRRLVMHLESAAIGRIAHMLPPLIQQIQAEDFAHFWRQMLGRILSGCNSGPFVALFLRRIKLAVSDAGGELR